MHNFKMSIHKDIDFRQQSLVTPSGVTIASTLVIGMLKICWQIAAFSLALNQLEASVSNLVRNMRSIFAKSVKGLEIYFLLIRYFSRLAASNSTCGVQ